MPTRNPQIGELYTVYQDNNERKLLYDNKFIFVGYLEITEIILFLGYKRGKLSGMTQDFYEVLYKNEIMHLIEHDRTYFVEAK